MQRLCSFYEKPSFLLHLQFPSNRVPEGEFHDTDVIDSVPREKVLCSVKRLVHVCGMSVPPVIYGADENGGWTEPEVWEKVNSVSWDYVGIDKVQAACDSAKQNPREENAFRQLCLNQWVKQAVRWMPMDKWDACSFTVNEEELEGMGFIVVPFSQGFKDMSPPTKELTKLTLEQKLVRGGHPVLRWMAPLL